MRYTTLSTVDYILVDGRKQSKLLEIVIINFLGALSAHMPFHVVILCSSVKHARQMDDLGDRHGMDLFFHGEMVDTPEEEKALVAASLLLVVPVASAPEDLKCPASCENIVPVLAVGKEYSLFYGLGQDVRPVRTTPLGALAMLQAGLQKGSGPSPVPDPAVR